MLQVLQLFGLCSLKATVAKLVVLHFYSINAKSQVGASSYCAHFVSQRWLSNSDSHRVASNHALCVRGRKELEMERFCDVALCPDEKSHATGALNQFSY